jgi:hypothetical protein
MFDEVPPVIPPLVATTQAATPSPEVQPPGEASLPPPTAEQAQAADHVFTDHAKHHPLVTLLGVATSVGLLRDVAVDTFDTSDEEEEEADPKHKKDQKP